MKSALRVAFLFFAVLAFGYCGGRKPEGDTTAEASKTGQASTEKKKTKEEKAAEAKRRIQNWLGKELAKRVANVGKDIGNDLGNSLARDQEVMSKARGLIDEAMRDPSVKAKIEGVADDATGGIGNKLTLLGKALFSGGLDGYKKRVKENTQRIAIEALTNYIKTDFLADSRTSSLLKGFGAALKSQGKVGALGLQENLSSRTTKKLLAVSLTIASASENDSIAETVNAWISECEDPANEEVEKLMRGLAQLPSVRNAIKGIAVDVLGHQRTKAELSAMIKQLVNDREVYNLLVKMYEAAAFEKGDSEIRGYLEQTLKLPVVQNALFETLDRLANADGAGPLMGKHVAAAASDPEMAEMVEEFVVNVLDACGDLTERLKKK